MLEYISTFTAIQSLGCVCWTEISETKKHLWKMYSPFLVLLLCVIDVSAFVRIGELRRAVSMPPCLQRNSWTLSQNTPHSPPSEPNLPPKREVSPVAVPTVTLGNNQVTTLVTLWSLDSLYDSNLLRAFIVFSFIV